MRRCFVLLSAVLLVAAAHAVPTATALKAEAPPVVDGKLDEPLWQGPPQLTNFSVLGEDRPAKEQTVAWIASDADNLYLAIKALESDMKGLKATVREREGKVFSDDVLEIFADPACTGFALVQLAFNPLGTQYDLSGDAVGMSPAWNGAWTVKTSRTADAWLAEVCIPLANFGLSKMVGREWALNVCRERHGGELSCWSQTGRKFCNPDAFGRVAIAADLAPYFIELGVPDWGQGIIGGNALSYSVRNTGAAPRKVEAVLEVTGPDGKTTASTPVALSVAPGKTVKQSLNYTLTQSGTHQLSLRLTDGARLVAVTDGARLVAVTGRALPVAPLAEFQIYKSFYRDDAVVRYRINVQPKHLALYRIEAVLHAREATAPLAVKKLDKLAAAGGELRFDTRALPNGQYVVDAVVRDRQGQALLSQALRFPQLADKSVTSRLVTVRRSDNMLIVQGKPFFPIGIYEAPGTERYMASLAEAGFNLCHCPGGSGTALRNLLDRVQAHHMRMWISMSGLMDFSEEAQTRGQKMAEVVKSVGDHPGLLVWESMDEPVWGGRNSDGYYDGYCFLRALDQQRPIWTNHAPRNTIAELSYFNRATDLGGVDIYPVPEPQSQSDLPNKAISVTGDECDKNVATVNGEKPIFMVLQGFGWAELSRKAGQPTNAVMPTLHQSRFMAYQSIVHGANGVLYWGTHYTEKPSVFWSELRSLVSELAALQGVLASEAVRDKTAARLAKPQSAVRLLHKRCGGANYVLLVNESAEPTTVSLVVPGLKAARLKRLFEDQQVPVSKQTAKLTLSGYGVAVLSDNQAFADKRKDFSADWKNPAPKPDPALLLVPGNLIANPGFEVDGDGDEVPDTWGPSVPLTAMLSPEAHSGKYALSLTGVGGDMAPLVVQRPTAILGGKEYTFTAWVKAPATAETRIYVEWSDGTHWYGKVLPWTKGTGEWQQLTLAVKGDPDPAGGAYAVAQVKGTGTALFDDLKLVEAAK